MANIVKEKEAPSSHGRTHMARRGEDLTYDGSGGLNIDNHETKLGIGLAHDGTEGRKKDEDMTRRGDGLAFGGIEGRDNTSQERGTRSAEDFQRKRRWSRRDHCESSDATSSEDEQANRTRRRGTSSPHRRRKRRHHSSSNSADDRSQPSKGRSRSKQISTNAMLDKFRGIITTQVRSCDKPKLTFNTYVIREFNPFSKEKTMLVWLTKVEDCRVEIYE